MRQSLRPLIVVVALFAAGCSASSPVAPQPPAAPQPKPIETTCFLIQNSQKIVIPCN